MILETEFTVTAPAARVFSELLDFESLAACLPGSDLKAIAGSRTLQGRLRPQLAGAAVDCIGTLRPVDIDEDGATATCSLRIHQVDGPGFAVGTLRGRLAPNGSSTRVAITAEARVAGVGAPQRAEHEAGALLKAFAGELERSIAERASKPAPVVQAAPAPPPAAATDETAPAMTSPAPGFLPDHVPAQAAGASIAALVSLVLALLLRRRRRRGAWLEFRYRW